MPAFRISVSVTSITLNEVLSNYGIYIDPVEFVVRHNKNTFI